jgi:ribose transport system permease protein
MTMLHSSSDEARRSKRVEFAQVKEWLITLPPAYYVLVVLFIIAPFVSPMLVNPSYWFIILKQSAPLGVAVLAQALVIRVRSIDLSVAGVFAMSIYLASSGKLSGFHPVVLILTPILLGLLVGVINGILIAYVRVSAVIATLSMSTILLGLMQFFSAGRAPGSIPAWIRTLTNERVFGVSWTVVIWIVASVVVALIMRYLVIGKYFRAAGDNPRAADVAGIEYARIVFLAHTFGGLLMGLAALMQVSATSVGMVEPGLGVFLNALAATILGGVAFGSDRGGVAGPFVAVIAFSFLFAILTVYGIQEPGKLIAQGSIIALAALVYGLRNN